MVTFEWSNLKACIFYCMLFNMINAQTTSDCSTKYGCFLSPSNCVDNACNFIYKWKNNSDNIDFVLAAKFSSTSNKWLGIGFSDDQNMGSDSVVICKSTNPVQTYYNNGKSSSVMDGTNPTFGLSSSTVTTSNGFLMCSFSRQIKNSANSNFFDLSKTYYVLVGYGNLQTKKRAAGDLNQHDSTDISSDKIDFSSISITSSGTSGTLARFRAHGCLMVIAWLLFASTGIIISRYFRNLLSDYQLCGTDVWFALHRGIMPLVPIISIIALLVILSGLSWEWVETDDKVALAHSIIGMIAIGLAFFQPFMALCRCHPGTKYRFIFNFFHRTVGLLALVLAIVALFLGSKLSAIKLEDNGWGLLLGWTVWLAIASLLLEILSIIISRRTSFPETYYYEPQQSRLEYVKIGILILHIIVTLAFTIALLVIIGTAAIGS